MPNKEYISHEEALEAAAQAAAEARQAYEKDWPEYCRTCGGWGAFILCETHGLPSSGEVLSEPCNDCTQRYDTGPQQCARCGERGLDEDGTGPCTNCGWNYDDGIPQAW